MSGLRRRNASRTWSITHGPSSLQGYGPGGAGVKDILASLSLTPPTAAATLLPWSDASSPRPCRTSTTSPTSGTSSRTSPADAFARYCRLARLRDPVRLRHRRVRHRDRDEGPRGGRHARAQLCDRYHAVHADIYRWFDISFDQFGRTSVPVHTEITQHIFTKLHENGYIVERTLQQPYCERCARFLADRYVLGTCPHCRYPDARGDQCESCGKLLDPSELVEPRCSVCGARPGDPRDPAPVHRPREGSCRSCATGSRARPSAGSGRATRCR